MQTAMHKTRSEGSTALPPGKKRKEFSNLKIIAIAEIAPARSVVDWKAMGDEQVLERAQKTIYAKGFENWDSFAKVYKGIAYEIMSRGLPKEGLEFRKAKPVLELVREEAQPKASIDWQSMDGDELHGRAQAKMTEGGFADYPSFAAVYRGIHVELYKRGFTEADFEYCEATPVSHVRPIELRAESLRSRISAAWDEMSDDQVQHEAQAKIDRDGFQDWDSFTRVYRGIFVELFKRGFSHVDFEFGRSDSA